MINWQDSRKFFASQYGEEPEVLCCAPGRINLIGEHIDYAGGQVLPMSISLGVSVMARPTDDGLLRCCSALYPDAGIVNLAEADSPPFSYIRELAGLTGITSAEIAICSNLPSGMGLSSSAAIGIAVQGALLALKDDPVLPSARAVCRGAQRAEHTALGTNCGLMDQYVSMFGQVDSALHIDLEHELHREISLLGLAGTSFVLVDSGQRRELADSAYNERREEMLAALARVREYIRDFNGLASADHNHLLLIEDELPKPLDRRLRHLNFEMARVKIFCELLSKNPDARLRSSLGELLLYSHASLRDNAQVSTKEIDSLWNQLRRMLGCLGVRLMGGGFGGSLLLLLQGQPDPARLDKLLRRHRKATGLSGSWMQVHPGPGAYVASGPDNQRSVAQWLS